KRGTSEREPLFQKRIGVVVVAEPLPESGLVVLVQLDPADPLGALPEVLARDDQPERPAVLGGEGLAVRVGREYRSIPLEELDRDVRGEAGLRVRDRESSRRTRARELGDRGPRDSREGRVEPAP